jgi:hypothetical protein
MKRKTFFCKIAMSWSMERALDVRRKRLSVLRNRVRMGESVWMDGERTVVNVLMDLVRKTALKVCIVMLGVMRERHTHKMEF